MTCHSGQLYWVANYINRYFTLFFVLIILFFKNKQEIPIVSHFGHIIAKKNVFFAEFYFIRITLSNLFYLLLITVCQITVRPRNDDISVYKLAVMFPGVYYF